MKEEQLNTLREQDKNLRDAIRMEEAEMPQMPADLNARLMQRMSREPKKARTRRLWPWVAAACVAGVMMIWLTPPKEQMPTVAMQTPSQQTPSPTLPLNGKEEVSAEVSKVEEPVVAKVEKKEVPQRTPRAKKVQDTQKTLTPQAADVCNDLAAVQEQEESTPLPSGEGQKGEAVVTLTEHDIPITRPENYKYTPEELALMRKQANEAYLKWVQLELEISKYNLEQTAQK